MWPFKRAEKRATMLTTTSDLSSWLGGGQLGESVSAMRSEFLSAVTAAIDAIAGAVGSLPAYVYRISGNSGKDEDPGHPISVLIRDGWNPNLTWPDGVQWFQAECLRYGNAVAEKIYDARGVLRELRPLSWSGIAAKILPAGRLVYDFTDPVTAQRRRLLDTEVIHLRDRSDNGLIGRARTERASPVIAAALSLQQFAGNAMRNGAFPSGVVELEKPLTKPGIQALRAEMQGIFAGAKNAGRFIILDNSAKWKSITPTPEDLELLSARRFAIEEAARLYQVPPPIIGDLSHGTFTNSETLIRYFAQHTISVWCRKIEAEAHRSLLTDAERQTHRFELDLSGLLRGDPETRWKSHEIALRNQVLTPNEVRDVEGWNPRAGGDAVLVRPPSNGGPAPVQQE
jgi:HK97 family phage portal protein